MDKKFIIAGMTVASFLAGHVYATDTEAPAQEEAKTENAEASCGAGSCGANMQKEEMQKAHDGNCGGNAQDPEGTCGAAKTEEAPKAE